MILGMYQAAYDWMVNIIPETKARAQWKKNADFTIPLEENELVPLFPSRTPEETYGALFFIKFHYYQQCLVKEAFQQSFLLGTHDPLGTDSLVYRFGGNELVLREIFYYLVPEGTFTKKGIQKSGEVLQQLHELLRNPAAKPLWNCLATSSMIIAETFLNFMVLCRQLSPALLRWKNFSEGTTFLKDFFRKEEVLSSKEK
jgi:hypothetical protein